MKALKPQPPYVAVPRDPEPGRDYGKAIPRIVNRDWLVLALMEQARADRRGRFLPWNPAALLERAAIELRKEHGR